MFNEGWRLRENGIHHCDGCVGIGFLGLGIVQVSGCFMLGGSAVEFFIERDELERDGIIFVAVRIGLAEILYIAERIEGDERVRI